MDDSQAGPELCCADSKPTSTVQRALPQPRADQRPTTVLLLASAGAFLANLGLFIVNIALPDIRQSFAGTDLAGVAWVLNAYTVVFAALLTPAGRLADRYGRRLVFLIGAVVFTVASAACAAAVSVPLLVAFRAVQAIGAALMIATSLALILAAFPPAKRTTAVGFWAAINALAATTGPPMGGLLVELSWRWVFLVNLPIGVLILLIGPRVLAERKAPTAGMPDALGAVGLVLGVGALTWAFVEAGALGWTGGAVLAAFGVAALSLAWVVWRSMRHQVPVLDLHALRVPSFGLACAAMLLFSAGFGAMVFGNVLFLTGIWHISAAVAGLMLVPGALAVVVTAPLGGRLTDRFGSGPVVAAGGIVFAVGAAWWIWLLDSTADFTSGLLPGQVLAGIGIGLLMPSLNGVVGLTLPAPRWGAGSSMINTSRQVGIALGTAVTVALYGSELSLPGFQHSWLLIIATTLATAVAGFIIAAQRANPSTSDPQ
ncbi:DHA2 family efflux MFS transporter permease subunit [Saccharopolyspora sp. K220]|uniref:DHA2 family efflux MFS transporter permease subunit n=1 Tax=Saccharopolyspora soli TaxID=2926618 RepID=UPI001F56C9AA|nr:DHA2 family efflux MFS transporter permease subunit [Saccharopolyspora soli]MCI2418168.1 DHA2 family efflux MFS transporter permease subunit [Saccharopolyspora soli]